MVYEISDTRKIWMHQQPLRWRIIDEYINAYHQALQQKDLISISRHLLRKIRFQSTLLQGVGKNTPELQMLKEHTKML
jgi:hypothetical protein